MDLEPSLRRDSSSSPSSSNPPEFYHPTSDHHPLIPSDAPDEHQIVQYANPMNDPYAEVELGWSKITQPSSHHHLQHHPQDLAPRPISDSNLLLLPHSNDQVLHQLSDFSFDTHNHQAHHPFQIHPSPNQTSLPTPSLHSFYHPHPNSHQPINLQGSQAPPKPRKLSLPSSLLHPQSNHHPFNPNPATINLSLRRSDHHPLFRPPNSSSASKTSFSSNELSFHPSTTSSNPSRTRLSSFSTDLEPISGSPTSPLSPHSPLSLSSSHRSQLPPPPTSSPHSRPSLPPSFSTPANPLSSSSSSSFSSSEDCLLRRASSSSLASITSISSTTHGLKARRGLTKPLSLTVPHPTGHQSNIAQALATPLRLEEHANQSKLSTFSRSLPPSPRFGDSAQARAQFVGMKANVTGGLSMKRRTSIPRLTLGFTNPKESSRAYDPVQLIGRNHESSGLNTPVQLHFDPVAAVQGRQELMSSQAGVGGKGHIEVPSESTETFPYEHGPKEVLPDVFLGSEQNARDGNLLCSMGFGLIINVAKEVECPWEPTSSPAPIEQAWSPPPKVKGLMVRPTASTPNLKRSFEGKVRVSLPDQRYIPNRTSSTSSSSATTGIQMKRLSADHNSSRPSLDYVKLPWSHDQDGLAEIFSSTEVFNLIDRARDNKLKTLIHCQCGVSRSATLMIGYCMREAVRNPAPNLPISGRMHDAYSFVKERSPWAGPNMGLIYQLIEYEKVLFRRRRDTVEEEEEEEEEIGITQLVKKTETEGPWQIATEQTIQEEEEPANATNRMVIEEEPVQVEKQEDHTMGEDEPTNHDLAIGRDLPGKMVIPLASRPGEAHDPMDSVADSLDVDRIESTDDVTDCTSEGYQHQDHRLIVDVPDVDSHEVKKLEGGAADEMRVQAVKEEQDIADMVDVRPPVGRQLTSTADLQPVDLTTTDPTPRDSLQKSSKGYYHHYFTSENPSSLHHPSFSSLEVHSHHPFVDLDEINLRTSTS